MSPPLPRYFSQDLKMRTRPEPVLSIRYNQRASQSLEEFIVPLLIQQSTEQRIPIILQKAILNTKQICILKVTTFKQFQLYSALQFGIPHSVPKDRFKTKEKAWVYQSMPSLRDVAHGGVLCTFRNRSSPDRGVSGVVCQSRRQRPSITYKITPLFSQPGGFL